MHVDALARLKSAQRNPNEVGLRPLDSSVVNRFTRACGWRTGLCGLRLRYITYELEAEPPPPELFTSSSQLKTFNSAAYICFNTVKPLLKYNTLDT